MNVDQVSEFTVAVARAAASAAGSRYGKFSSKSAQELIENCDLLVPSFEEALDKYLALSRILRPIGQTIVSAVITPFVVRDHFRRDISESAKVKISYLGNGFLSCFGNQVVQSRSGYGLAIHELTKSSLDNGIQAELNECYLTDVAAIYEMIARQPNGKKNGDLLVNGCTNICYAAGINGEVRVVSMFWYGAGWIVYANPVDLPSPWREGYWVLSRNS